MNIKETEYKDVDNININKQGVIMWNGCIWFRIGSSGGLL